ncbi:MAG: hypothetical protein HPY62_12890, partial [Bacteroidales bacterium]|nr:hypothetical protein [Bacteroidales bacterium]
MAYIIILTLIAGLAIIGYFIRKDRQEFSSDPYQTISKEAAIIIETNELQNLLNLITSGKGIFGELGQIKEFGPLKYKLDFITEKLKQPGFNRILDGNKSIIAFYPTQEGRLEPLLSMSIPSEIKIRHLKGILNDAGVRQISEKSSDNKKLILLPYSVNGSTDTLILSVFQGLLLCSTSEELTGKAILVSEERDDIRSFNAFSRILSASGKNQDKLFIVFKNLEGVIKPLFSDNYKFLSGNFGLLAGSAGGDVYLSENLMSLSGYTEFSNEQESLFKYKSVLPRALETFKILPATTVLFKTFIYNEKPRVLDDGGKYTESDKQLALDLNPFIIGGEVTKALLDIKDRPVSENMLLIYQLKNRVQCEQILVQGLNSKTDIIYYQPDDQTRIPVYRTGTRQLHSILFPGLAEGFEDSFYSFYENFMVAGNSFNTVARFLYDNLLRKTLVNDISYREFEKTMPSRAGFYFYCVPGRIIEYLDGILAEDVIAGFKSNRGSLEKIQALGYQFASSNEMLYNTLSFSFREEVREESVAEWETLLDTVAGIKPFFFTNHNTGAREIFVQDLNNNAYLINAAGRILWKVPLQERIRGNIYMIDYYKNGKYQLLFSGKSYLHLLDRNGNYVERYPVKLRSPAANSLALFDYDNNKDYRLMIAGEDKILYSYDKSGSVVKGWNQFRTAGLVNSEVSFFRVSGKDYIVAADDNAVYFLDRKGNVRLNPDEAVIKASGSAVRLSKLPEPSVVVSSPDGTINHIYFDRKVKKYQLGNFSETHSFD